MTTLVIAYHSGYGHTAQLAKKVAEGVEKAGAKAVLHNVAELTDQLWADIKAADGVIFGSPTYMANVSAPFKAFMDASSKPWFGQEWKDKIAAGFTNSGSPSGDKMGTLISLATFAAQHSMVWVNQGIFPNAEGQNRLSSWLGLMAQSDNSSAASESNPMPQDQAYAVAFGERVALATIRWSKSA
jgi:multimeric flavodoxin WrbA